METSLVLAIVINRVSAVSPGTMLKQMLITPLPTTHILNKGISIFTPFKEAG